MELLHWDKIVKVWLMMKWKFIFGKDSYFERFFFKRIQRNLKARVYLLLPLPPPQHLPLVVARVSLPFTFVKGQWDFYVNLRVTCPFEWKGQEVITAHSPLAPEPQLTPIDLQKGFIRPSIVRYLFPWLMKNKCKNNVFQDVWRTYRLMHR